MILLDASVLLAAEDTDDVHHRAAGALLQTGALATVDLALYETTNVATVRWKAPDAAKRLAERIWAIGELGVLIRADRPLIESAAAVATEQHLSAYDATYVAAARRLGVSLASCDERDLVSAGLAALPETILDS